MSVRPTAWRVTAGDEVVSVGAGAGVSVDMRRGAEGCAFVLLTTDEAEALADVMRAAAAVVRGDAPEAAPVVATALDGKLMALALVRAALGAGEGEHALDAAQRVAAEVVTLREGWAAGQADRDRIRADFRGMMEDRTRALADAVAAQSERTVLADQLAGIGRTLGVREGQSVTARAAEVANALDEGVFGGPRAALASAEALGGVRAALRAGEGESTIDAVWRMSDRADNAEERADDAEARLEEARATWGDALAQARAECDALRGRA